MATSCHTWQHLRGRGCVAPPQRAVLPARQDAHSQHDVGLTTPAIIPAPAEEAQQPHLPESRHFGGKYELSRQSGCAAEVIVEGEDAEDGHPVAWCSGET